MMFNEKFSVDARAARSSRIIATSKMIHETIVSGGSATPYHRVVAAGDGKADMNEGGSDGSTVRNEFEEIHSRRRLVMEYPISATLKVTVVILDFKDVSKGDSMPECAAMLVPTGKESDWMYSSEGGQWQLLASAGVMRLILFSRAHDTMRRNVSGEETEKVSSAGGADTVLNADSAAQLRVGFRKIARRGLKSSEPARVAGDTLTLRGREISTDEGALYFAPLEKSRLEEVNGEIEQRGLSPVHVVPNSRSRAAMEQHEERKRKCAPVEGRTQLDGPLCRLKLPVAESLKDEDDALKLQLRPLALALAPSVSPVRTGVLDIPFVDYVDNIVQRVIVEEAVSPLIGLMRVEDVELETRGTDAEEQGLAIGESNGTRVPPADSPLGILRCPQKAWRRRLIFRRMPNLIQTEVLLKTVHSKKQKTQSSDSHLKKSKTRDANPSSQSSGTLMRTVDHSKLVHKYLPPIVAGFVLVSPCLDAFCVSSSDRAKILCVGVGGGALPIFLQRHFPFRIQVVELDEVVLRLAKKHFGLTEESNIDVTIGDGLTAVEDMAARALEACHVDESLRNSWTNFQDAESPLRASSCRHEIQDSAISAPLGAVSGSRVKGGQESDADTEKEYGERVLNNLHRQSLPRYGSPTCAHIQRSEADPRVHIIILDVDACDSQLELNSPPRSFLGPKFLLSVRLALQSGGMLAINVVPAGRRAYEGVIRSLEAFFAEIYEIALKDDLNRVVFALLSPVRLSHRLRDGGTFHLVKHLVGEELIQRIQRIDSKS